MLDIAAEGLMLRIVYAVMMVGVVWLVLRGLDRLAGVDFRNIMEVISADPKAAALYMGLRFLGVVLGMGLIIS